MPELPEVEAARRALEEHCVGKRIVRCSAADDTKVIDGVAPAWLEAALVGRTIAAARRKGKNLWLVLDSPPFPSFQFGMAGAIYIKGVELSKYKRSAVGPSEEWPSKYSKLFVELNDGLEFSFTDKRRFAKLRLLENPEAVPPISELGPDVLFEPMQLDDFVRSLGRKNVPIKALFLDQSFMSGIGNWVADEVLYQARIHPKQTASIISKEKCKRLYECINEVIKKSLEVGADSSQFPEFWIFHSRDKKPGKAFVDGKRIEFIAVAGRTSAYVPELQKLDGVEGAGSRSKEDKVDNDDTKSKEGRNAPEESNMQAMASTVHDEEGKGKSAKQRVKAAKGTSNNLTNEEEVKSAKRGRKQTNKVSSKKAANTHDNEVSDDENAIPAKKKGRKQQGKTENDPSKQDHHASEDDSKDVDEEADHNVDAKSSKRRGPKQPMTETKRPRRKRLQP